jgi:hypothetical protein
LVWVRAPKLNYFKVRGLVPPGSYSHDDNQKRGNIAVNKSGKGVVGTKTDYVQAWKKEHALANGQVLDRKGKIGISENKARCGLPRIIQRKENAPGAVRGSICIASFSPVLSLLRA